MKIKNYIPVILCSIALCSCSDADKNIAFGLDSDAIKAEAAGGSHKIKVSASGDWVATTDEPWISISPANGRGTTECRILIDSALTDSPRRGVVRIQEQNTWDKKEITIDQQGFDYAITLGEKEVSVANFSAFGTRYFDVKVKTNVDFAVEVPTSAESWLKFDSYKVELDRGIRPREVTVRFNWSINSQPNERIADVVFKPKREVELARQDNLLVTQGAAEPIEENTRSGDSIALLAIARTLGTNSSWENGERMDNWDDVTLWEEGMAGYTPEKNGRVKYARFFMFDTKEELPFEVQYLTAADELNFYSNVNAFLKDLTTGEYITKLTQLKRLTIAAYGLVSLDKNFTALKNLEFLDLSSNNFQKIPDEINPTNFPKLRTLLMGANTRRNIYDLSNTVETNYGGLVDEEGFPRRMIEWDLDTLQLSVNYLQGPLPKMDDWEKYTEQDIIDADTLPRALIGTPKVMPHTKRFAINLNFPKLRTLLMGANTRRNIYDLSNTVETNYGGLVDEEGFPRRMIEWDLDTLQLSVNYLQGPLPKMDDWEKYTEQDIIDADTLPRALIGTPKVMPHTKRFAINLNRLTGELPDWLLYHPALDWWSPFQLVFTQEGKDATGASAGFGNEPANLNYYYEFYEGYKKDPGAEEEDEDTTK